MLSELPEHALTSHLPNMASNSYIGDLCKFHADLRAFVSQNPGHTSQSQPARSNLEQLPLVRFNEICVDVFDDLRRRRALAILQGLGDFQQLNALPPLPSVHPRRNSAREKISSVQTPRFVTLCAALVFELERRFACLVEHPSNPSPNDEPPPGYPEIIDEEPPPRYSRTADEIMIGMVVPETWI